jgi:hypothetical protein
MNHDQNVICYFAEIICLMQHKRWHRHQHEHGRQQAEQQNEVIIIIPCNNIINNYMIMITLLKCKVL